MQLRQPFFTATLRRPRVLDVICIGIPFEGRVNSRKGAHQGPSAIRKASHYLESYSGFSRRDLLDVQIWDIGDIRVRKPLGNIQHALIDVERQLVNRLPQLKRTVFLGGDHTITLPAVACLLRDHRELRLVHFDAHFDSMEQFAGERYCYGSWAQRLRGLMANERIFQIGMRAGTRAEFDAWWQNENSYPLDKTPLATAVAEVASRIGGAPVYVTFDIDVLDPSFAHGTGNPESGGVRPREIFQAIQQFSKLNVVGFDVVEVSPRLDASEATALVAAEIVREGIVCWWGK